MNTTVDPTTVSSPVAGSFSGQSTRSRSSTKLDDVTSLTSFNPFAEEDEHDQGLYTLTSLFSKVKNTFSAPLLGPSTTTPATPSLTNQSQNASTSSATEQRRLSSTALQGQASNAPTRPGSAERPFSFTSAPARAAPPLVSLTPAQSEMPSLAVDYEASPTRPSPIYPSAVEPGETTMFGASIPGFPIPDDARSIKTTASLHRSGSVSKVMRRLRGEGLSRDYWMDDENCKECYDCKSVFTAWRRKHHCRICGQIFCSRCASNIIKGTRFGQNERIRVCNLCLEKLATVDEDDDDDRRSIVSSASFPAHQFGADVTVLPQSPFAASQLFGRTDEPFNLYSIAETKKVFHDSENGSPAQFTPPIPRKDDTSWAAIRANPAPFRRAVTDEEKDQDIMENLSSEISIGVEPAPSPTPLNGTPLLDSGATSFIQFPTGSPERDGPYLAHRNRMQPETDLELATPFIRSRVQSRLDTLSLNVEPGWRTRRESTAYAQELNLTSMLHLKIMLRQMLSKEEIPNIKEWEETLLRLALRIARELTFTSLPHRQGEDMDVRRYVKIKKIPGGRPCDSEYVNGAVITKNVAHKQMSRLQNNPRIMLVTFPLEFHRVEGQYMHFGQIVRQEKEYLGNLASRIAALRPHVVLVEKSVSRLALDALVKYNIAVARNVKHSAIATVARMTQGDEFSSIDKLALEPKLGHCGRFRIQTYDHPLIPGRRKTYMRFEGCSSDLGCTIVLRGGDIEALRRIKKVTRFLTFIVRNLKLETHLWKDSVITLPSFNPEAIPTSLVKNLGRLNVTLASLLLHPSSLSTPRLATPVIGIPAKPAIDRDARTHEEMETRSSAEEDENDRLSRSIERSIEPYRTTFISVSATLRFSPPYPIKKMKELDEELQAARRAWEDDIVLREEMAPSKLAPEPTISVVETPSPSLRGEDHREICAQIEALKLPDSASPALTSPQAATPEENPYFAATSLNSSSTDVSFLPTMPTLILEEPREHIKTISDIALESRYLFVKWKHEEFRRVWEWYLRKNADDFVVEKYQQISLLEYTVPVSGIGENSPCFPPRLTRIQFYGENDMTLGQFIEKVVTDTLVQFLDPKAICTGKGCDQPLARHCKVYIHNETRLFIAVEQWDGQIINRTFGPAPDLITTWSACRVCGSATPFIPVSPEMQRYSFAKFLELHFYPADVKLVQGAGCEHNIYQHHIRYFACRGMTVRFQTDPVIMHEIVYPPFRVPVRPETQLEIKNVDFEKLHYHNLIWYTALIDDLKLICIDAATGDEETDAKLNAEINILISRAETEREEVNRLINKVYRESAPTDTLALNQVHAYRQDKIVAWQQDFDRLPKPKPTTMFDRSKGRAAAFNSVKNIWPQKNNVGQSVESSQTSSVAFSEVEDGSHISTRQNLDLFASSASEAEVEPEITPEPERVIEVTTDMAPRLSEERPENQLPSITISDAQEESAKSENDSDSTIGANHDDPLSRAPNQEQMRVNVRSNLERSVYQLSRLPRRQMRQSTVAELVKKYQDFLPPQTTHDLAKSALPPRSFVSESEQEYPNKVQHRPLRRGRHTGVSRKASTSDFESSYAANIAPRYLMHKRPANIGMSGSRIPGPPGQPFDSHTSSRRTSPEKRMSSNRGREVHFSRPSSPPNIPGKATHRYGKARAPLHSKEKTLTRALNVNGKANYRKMPSTTNSKVLTLARNFDRLGKEAERTKNRYNIIRGKRARPVASTPATVEVLESVKDALKDDEPETTDSSSEADDEGDGNDEGRLIGPTLAPQGPPATLASQALEGEPVSPPSVPLAAPVVSILPELSGSTGIPPTTPSLGPISLPPSPLLLPIKPHSETATTPPVTDLELPVMPHGSTSFFKTLSELWQPRHSAEMDDPMSDPEHIFRDSSMIVRTDEPTSIIALALNSPQYREMLTKSRAEKRTAREAKLTEGELFMPDDKSIAESTSTWGVVNIDPVDTADPTEDLRLPSSKLPWAISFESGGLTISCTILYPEQFDALRRTYDCEKSMVESLSRCVKWNTGGGKSGSAFLKTRDDRYIAKELSKSEVQTMESFAPAYFDYMSSAVSAKRPTLLAKVFGCYKLTFRKNGKGKGPAKSKSTQMNLLVMENLFYGRRFTKIYDLKGSTRNRHVQSTGKENEVLLDENLIQTAHLNPFYLREHSKRILRGALCNDSKFLADINVMDYSLVCGVDSQNNELVVGIVDYIRTYTWDKKLESWVKEWGAGKEPTIVTPKQYRQRFLAAMERYFPLIPDRWMKRDLSEDNPHLLSEFGSDW